MAVLLILSDVGSSLLIITLAIHKSAATTAKTRYDYLSDFTHIWEAVYADSDAYFDGQEGNMQLA